ncbi:MAG: ion transporter [Gemmatimonadaceae bacterium]|nr:ion transporter [Gemmatimonadaceae bacterium]
MPADDSAPDPLRHRLHQVIFEADTRAGKAFDTILLVLILASVAVVALDSSAAIRARYGPMLPLMEWVFTFLFTVEYALRLYSVARPLAYARSFFGVVDLLAILPSFVSLVIPGTQSLLVIRILRLLRVFRVFKLSHYLDESRQLGVALKASRRKILIFIFTVLTIVVIVGAMMHVVEGPANGFTSIPMSMYWAVVTLTTVGYGDISPQTPLGRLLATLVMLMGYGIIAVPTGIVSAEISRSVRGAISTRACPHCLSEGHMPDANFCRTCGEALRAPARSASADSL